MFRSNETVVALLKQDYPDVVTIKCSCHMIHLCASYACLKLSTSLEDLVRNVYAHFSRSSKRLKYFEVSNFLWHPCSQISLLIADTLVVYGKCS